jgi:anti-anti-sigma factor
MEQLTVKRPPTEHRHSTARDIDAQHRHSFTFALVDTPGALVARLDGELDLACAQDFAALRAALAERRPPCVLLDAGRVTFIDCAGFGLVVALNRAVRAGGGTFFLTNPSPAVGLLLSLSRAAGPVVAG